MSAETLWISVQNFLGKEARYLDEQQWDQWLALYDENAEFWVPAWLDEGGITSDPLSQVSFIYYSSRRGLEDRVFRVKEGRTAASVPFPRTCHFLNLLSVEVLESDIQVHTSWRVDSFRDGQNIGLYGRARYRLFQVEDTYKIISKKVILVNDITDAVIDFYSI